VEDMRKSLYLPSVTRMTVARDLQMMCTVLAHWVTVAHAEMSTW
jgi:hypothetical protein